MKDKLETRIERILDNESLFEEVWKVIDSYLLDDIDQSLMYYRISCLLKGNKHLTDIICWFVYDFVNEVA